MPELAVIVPTFNERDNVVPMVDALQRALAGIDFEVILVDDDSPDGTAAAVRELSAAIPNVRVLQRINRRGLASAAVEGMMASSAPYVAVIDGDMQHDETILPQMLRKLKSEGLDIVIGTRNTAGGSMGHFAAWRVTLSNLGRRISTAIAHTTVSDPMSGFFMLTRSYLEEVVRSLSSVGFKVLLDLLASAKRPVRAGEVGYTFRDRLRGESKLNTTVCLEYVELVLDKLIGDWVPVRYAFFGLIGAIGVLVQLALVACLRYSFPFVTALAVGCSGAMVLNYVLNNRLTFRVRRLRGWAWVRGLFSFIAACSVGLYCNLHVASGLYSAGLPWLPASLGGIFVGSVWNYGVSSMLVWRVNRRYRRAVQARVLRHPEPAVVRAEVIGLP
jgi:dolichol-phosphate mannosyltransferase